MSQPLHIVFKALGHPKRLEIVKRLIKHVHHCCEVNQNQSCCLEEPTCDFGTLVDELKISKSSMSLHLKELKYAGLVESIKEGRQVILQINPDRLEELKNFFDVSIDQQTLHMMKVH